MRDCLAGDAGIGNPSSSTHYFGKVAADLIEQARGDIAALIGADPRELIFTSGATESDNLAIKGFARANRARGRHILTSAIEHKAVLDSCHQLEGEGFEVTYLKPGPDGLVTPAAVAEALRDDTILVSVMHANNEIGNMIDIQAVGEMVHNANGFFHCDTVQTMGHYPFDLQNLNTLESFLTNFIP